MTVAAKVLIVIGTPLQQTLTHAVAASYGDAARAAGAEVRVVDLARDPIPGHPTQRNELRVPRGEDDVALDAEVADYIDLVEWADHLVFTYPQWWGTYPAALSAFIDRVFLSGAAFRYHATGRLWDRLLTGRSARVIMLMDSPSWWNRFWYRNASETSLTRAVLGYCGIRTLGVTRFSEVRHRDDAVRHRWLAQVARVGGKDAVSIARRRGGVRVTA